MLYLFLNIAGLLVIRLYQESEPEHPVTTMAEYARVVFIMVHLLHIMYSFWNCKKYTRAFVVKLLTINMHILSMLTGDFNVIYLIRVITWFLTTPTFLEVLPYHDVLVLQENSHDWCLILHEVGYVLEFAGIILKMNWMPYHLFVFSLFGVAYSISMRTSNSNTERQLYASTMTVILASYGVIRALYILGCIDAFQQWLLYCICDINAKGLLTCMTKYSSHIAAYDGNYIVLFFDLEGFTDYSKNVLSSEVAQILDSLYTRIDRLLQKYDRIEKVETVGDEYMAVAKLNVILNKNDEKSVEQAFLFMQQCLATVLTYKETFVGSRAGASVGKVTRTMIGVINKRIQYFGNTVNIGSRMESNSQRNMLRITDELYQLAVRCNLDLVAKEETTFVKGVGYMKTHLVDILSSEIIPKHRQTTKQT